MDYIITDWLDKAVTCATVRPRGKIVVVTFRGKIYRINAADLAVYEELVAMYRITKEAYESRQRARRK